MTNEEVIARGANTTDEWIRTKLGIETRHIAADDEQTSDLATHAIHRALEAANLRPDELDGIICAVGIGDVPIPATACYIQEKLGISNMGFALDVKMACAGSIGGMMFARGLIESGMARNVAVVGTQLMSRTILDWDDRTVAPIFGDGAGAAILSPAPDSGSGILESRLHADGKLTGIIGQYVGGSRQWYTPELVRDKKVKLEMNGSAVWDCATEVLPKVMHEVVEAGGYQMSDVDFVVSHQANRRMLLHILERAGVPLDRTYTNMDRYGNTGPASSLIALDEAARRGHLQRGKLAVFTAIGAGMMWGAHLIRW